MIIKLVDVANEILRNKNLCRCVYGVDIRPSEFDGFADRIATEKNAELDYIRFSDVELPKEIKSAIDKLICAGYTSGKVIGAKFFRKCGNVSGGKILPIVMLFFGEASNFDDALNYIGDDVSTCECFVISAETLNYAELDELLYVHGD